MSGVQDTYWGNNLEMSLQTFGEKKLNLALMNGQEWGILGVILTSQMQTIRISKLSHFILSATLTTGLKLP